MKTNTFTYRVIIVFTLLLMFLSGCSSNTELENRSTFSNKSMYSWNREIFEEPLKSICPELRQYGIETIYQGLYPNDFSELELSSTVKRYLKEGVEIAYLVGDPSWRDSETVIKWALEPMVLYNSKVKRDSQIKKVCFDIEFFNSLTDVSFDDYLLMMNGIANYCHEHEIKVVCCLPYWVADVYGNRKLELLIEAIDELSCSVFLVGEEEMLIQPVVEICKRMGKKVEAILDLQPESEKYSVTLKNTYNKRGLEEALKTSEGLEQIYGISTSLHSLSEFRSLLQREFQ